MPDFYLLKLGYIIQDGGKAMRFLTNRYLGNEIFEKIKKLGYEILFIPEKEFYALSIDEIYEKYGEENIYSADIWLTYEGFDFLDIKRMRNLKYIHLTSAGINQVPLQYLKDNEIFLSNNKIGYAIPMAESIVMYILEVYKRTKFMFKLQEEKKWKLDTGWLELAGQKVGFFGTGNIAKEAAKRLKAFDVDIWGVNTDGRDIEFFDRCFKITDIDLFLKECDVFVGLMPSTAQTNNFIDSKVMEKMKENSILINIGRGNLIDEEALMNYSDKFRGIVLDVVKNEPLDENSPLWELDNIILTPHNSWVSEKNTYRLGNYVYENLKVFLETKKPKEYLKDFLRGY